MGHGVKVCKVYRVHQALHGYVGGHRQLALSATLSPGDVRTLLALSDVSGQGAMLVDDGYLTGYPLEESGVFAVGRTWPAVEMPRPGCVWTHTLLLDYGDLGTVRSLAGLLGLFRRPEGTASASSYGETVCFEGGEEGSLSPGAEEWLCGVVGALYGVPRARVVAECFGDEVEAAVLALWSQQWPDLRRGFRFCTLAADDRSGESGNFDLQVVAKLRGRFRRRFGDAVEAGVTAAAADPWLDDALDDLRRPGGRGLRQFLWRVGAGEGRGREAFRPLCRLYRALVKWNGQGSGVTDAIGILGEEGVLQDSSAARGAVAESALERVDHLDEASFRFLWRNRGALSDALLAREASRLGKAAWRREPRLLTDLLDGRRVTEDIVGRTLGDLDAEELVRGLAEAAELVPRALALRPELVGEAGLWVAVEDVDGAFAVAMDWDGLAAGRAVIAAGRSDLARVAVRHFGSSVVLKALRSAWGRPGGESDAWLSASVGDPGVVADFLGGESAIPLEMLYGLARILTPAAVPSEQGEDPWLLAYRGGVGTLSGRASSYMQAYLLSRALSGQSARGAELAEATFEQIHRALEAGELDYEGRGLLDSVLRAAGAWFAWDPCRRLRDGVGSMFVDADLAPELFSRLCNSDELFVLVVSDMALSKRGRSYLKRVRRFMRERGGDGLAVRAEIIDDILG